MKSISGLTYDERVAEYMKAGSRSGRILELIRQDKPFTEIRKTIWTEFGKPNKSFTGFCEVKFMSHETYEVYKNVLLNRLGKEEFQPRFKIGMRRAETVRHIYEVRNLSINEISKRANVTRDCAARTLRELKEINRFSVRITQDEYVALNDWLGGKWREYQDRINGSDDNEQDSEADE